jgi:hypothetical protein
LLQILFPTSKQIIYCNTFCCSTNIHHTRCEPEHITMPNKLIINFTELTITHKYNLNCGPGSIVGTVTGYRLDGPGIESRWGRDFPHLSRPAMGPTQPPVQWILGLSQGQLGRDDPSPPSSANGHESVELYFYSPYGPYGLYRASVPVQGWTLPFFFFYNCNTNKCTIFFWCSSDTRYPPTCFGHLRVYLQWGIKKNTVTVHKCQNHSTTGNNHTIRVWIHS